ncbi:MAG: hypothetical protein Q7Q73_09460 [Verrucomicrobiota bacterium JB024]|nr:hypothetical protein [Verrucomicrobiota bacterium JB024]
MNSVTRVGTRLRELRHRHGLTQQELAELAAFSLELHEFLAPELPAKTTPAKKVAPSRVHRR